MQARLAAVLLLVLASAPTVVEGAPAPTHIFSAAIFGEAVVPVRTSTLRGVQQVNEPALRLSSQALTFNRVQRVETEARGRLLDSLLTTTRDPGSRERIRTSVEDGEVWQEFDRILGFVGYSSRNLADVTTAYYVIAWEVVSGAQAIDYLSGVRFVRDSVARELLADPDVAGMTDAQKQEAAVVMAYFAIVAAHEARELRRAGNLAGLAVLREQVRRAVIAGQGVDLAALRLTNLGFVAD